MASQCFFPKPVGDARQQVTCRLQSDTICCAAELDDDRLRRFGLSTGSIRSKWIYTARCSLDRQGDGRMHGQGRRTVCCV